MEKYLMMLYVTLDQEKALKAFFSKHGWLFCKPDLSRLTDKLGPFVVPADARDEEELDVDDGDTLQTKNTNSKTTPKKKRVYAKRKCTAKRKCAAKKTKVESSNMTDSEESVQEIPDSIPSTSTVLHEKTIRHDHEETLPLVMHCDNGDKVGIKCERIDSELTEEIKLGTANDSDLTATVSYIDSQNAIESDVGRQRSKLPYKPTDTNKDLKKDVISTKDDDDDGNETINDDDDNDDDYGTINDNNDDNNEMHDDADNETIDNDDAEMFGNDKDSLDGTLENSGLEAIVDSLSTTDTEGADHDNTGDGLSQTDKKKDCSHFKDSAEGSLLNSSAEQLEIKTEANHICDKCGKTFKLAWLLHRHVKTHSKNGCDQCNTSCSHYTHLCPRCGKSFASISSLKRHSIVHQGHGGGSVGKVFKCPAEGCEKTFSRRYRYNDHVKGHNKISSYVCSQCNKPFMTRDTLKKHMDVCSSLSGSCFVCHAVFSTKQTLNVHMESKHFGKTYQCVCGKMFKYVSSLSRHHKLCGHNK